jgi:SAM-dependent methyltransferase
VSKLDNCNFSENTLWAKGNAKGYTFQFHEKKDLGFQYIHEAIDLKEIPDSKYDFILASHVFEHTANPIKAIKEWSRILKNDGVILLIIPHKKGTFDHKRPSTSVIHLIEDYKNGVKENDLTHLPEILELHDLTLDPGAGDFNSFKGRSLDNFNNRGLHHHVFDENNIKQLFEYLGQKILKFYLISFFKPQNIILLVQMKKKLKE